MRHSFRIGLNFGVTSGVITTLGLLVGLNSGTHSSIVVIGGILLIAIADAFSDAIAIHISEESAGVYKTREIWEATISTFLFKFVFAITFAVPVMLLELGPAIVASVAWGLFLLAVLSYKMAKEQGVAPWKVVAEHVLVAIAVITITQYVGSWIEVFS